MVASTTFEQDVDKLIEAAIYLCELSADDPDFVMTKLVSLLYYADCEAYLEFGEPITGTTYIHFPHGPHPENWYQIRQRMEQYGDAEILYDTAAVGYQNYRVLPLRPANLELLSSDDRESLAAQVERFSGFNVAGIKHHAHQEVGWRSTEDGEPIPYGIAGVFSPSMSATDIRARRLANRPA